MTSVRLLLAMCLAAIVTGCGGGGSDTATPPTPPAATAPAITVQPQNTTVVDGQGASFSVSASGTAPLTYQWRRNGTDVAGATGASHAIAAVALADSGSVYSVVVGNGAGTVTSANATLTVTVVTPVTAPTIATQPANVSVVVGQTASFSVAAGGTAPLAYQWKKNGADIAGATAASYTTPATSLADTGAVFAVVVANAAGTVTSANAVLTVTTVPSSGRFVEAWSSADANTTTGSYQLGVVDPAAPASPLAIDQLPASVTNGNTIQRVRGGVYDAATATLSDVGTRHLVYVKGGSIYKVSLDKGGAAPAPVRLSNETQVQTGSLQVLAQSSSGDEALMAYFRATGPRRFVRLSTPAADDPLLAPVFPGDLLSTGFLTASINDPATGAITGYLWPSVLASGQTRLFRTDAAFGNPTSVAIYTSVDLSLRLGLGALTGAKMRGGYFFIADGSLRRYDFATGDIRTVFSGVTSKISGAIFDDDSIFVPVQTGAGAQLVKAPDTASSSGVVLVSGAPIGVSGLILQQTKDYVLLITGSTGATAVSVRKSDGFQTPLPAAGGLVFSWSVVGGLATIEGNSVGNRVFYTTINPGNVVGSVHADGTDRKETSGLPTDVGAMPNAVAAHRLLTIELGGLPVERLMIVAGQNRKWLDLASGDVGVTIGSLPSKLFPGFGCPKLPYRGCPIGRSAVLGYEENVPVSPGSSVPRLDAYFVSDQGGSLLRLTHNIP